MKLGAIVEFAKAKPCQGIEEDEEICIYEEEGADLPDQRLGVLEATTL